VSETINRDKPLCIRPDAWVQRGSEFRKKPEIGNFGKKGGQPDLFLPANFMLLSSVSQKVIAEEVDDLEAKNAGDKFGEAMCRFVPLCAALCCFVPLCAALCCFVPPCAALCRC